MREYAKVGPQFWHGKTGKALKAQGTDAVVVALYLMTCQHANMLGLYYLSRTYIAVDTGLPYEGACKGLQGACEAGFCKYDEGSEVVWVVEMAAYQVGETLEAKDNRCKGIQREYDALPDNPFLGDFYERYAAPFHMASARGDAPKKSKGLRSPSGAPPKPRTGTGARASTGARAGHGADDSALVSLESLIEQGVEPKAARDWLVVRKKKDAPLTETAWDGVKTEAAKAGMTPAEAVKTAAERNWQGFKASWLTDRNGKAANGPASVDTAARDAEAKRLLGFADQPPGDYVDA